MSTISIVKIEIPTRYVQDEESKSKDSMLTNKKTHLCVQSKELRKTTDLKFEQDYVKKVRYVYNDLCTVPAKAYTLEKLLKSSKFGFPEVVGLTLENFHIPMESITLAKQFLGMNTILKLYSNYVFQITPAVLKKNVVENISLSCM